MINLQAIKEAVERAGPTRVVFNVHGEACDPVRARKVHAIVSDVVFIREDGWTLGAPRWFALVAKRLWDGEWVGFWWLDEDQPKLISNWDGVKVALPEKKG